MGLYEWYCDLCGRQNWWGTYDLGLPNAIPQSLSCKSCCRNICFQCEDNFAQHGYIAHPKTKQYQKCPACVAKLHEFQERIKIWLQEAQDLHKIMMIRNSMQDIVELEVWSSLFQNITNVEQKINKLRGTKLLLPPEHWLMFAPKPKLLLTYQSKLLLTYKPARIIHPNILDRLLHVSSNDLN